MPTGISKDVEVAESVSEDETRSSEDDASGSKSGDRTLEEIIESYTD